MLQANIILCNGSGCELDCKSVRAETEEGLNYKIGAAIRTIANETSSWDNGDKIEVILVS